MKSMKRNIWLIFIVIRHSRWWIDCERRAIASNNNYEKRTFLHVLSFFFRQINVSRVADSTDRDEPTERQTNATSEPKIMMVAMPNINSDAEERGASLEWVENGRWLWLVCVFGADAHSSWTAVWQTGELNDGHEFSKCRCEKNEQQQQRERKSLCNASVRRMIRHISSPFLFPFWLLCDRIFSAKLSIGVNVNGNSVWSIGGRFLHDDTVQNIWIALAAQPPTEMNGFFCRNSYN